jgi:hypothetical protein
LDEYLKIPISLGQITEQKDLARCDVKASIHDMVHLISVTSYNEVRHDTEFGTEIWKYDFENIYNTHFLKEELKKSIKASISINEKRLNNVTVDLQIEQVEIHTRVQNKRVKTQLRMVVSGVIDKTNEKFNHTEMFFIGPLSY